MKHVPVHQLFERVAEQHSGQIAVEHADRRLSYAELDRRSNKLANFLIASATPKGSIVAMMLGDPVETIAAIIGVLKAGCVFVPFDRRTPQKQLDALTAEVAPTWFVTDEQGLAALAVLERAGAMQVICVDAPPPAHPTPLIIRDDYADYADTQSPNVATAPDDMCYIYFTSGSTGRPKGIAGRLKGIDHFIQWEIDTFGVGAGTRVSQLTTPAFDAILRDIFVPLCAGGTICVPSQREIVLAPDQLVAWIDSQQIALLHCVPSVFRAIVNRPLSADGFAALRTILMAGEPLLPADVKKWMTVYGTRVQLVNLYGPSETTMTKLFYLVQPADANRPSIPIGKPIGGARALVVDSKQQPCATGAVGEIYIRTPYRALGYYNQPELTSEVFIPNPFSGDPNDIVYKTGDLGRVLEDSNLEFVGRRDRQVKVRGVRVELAAIESTLREHVPVRDVAVVDRSDPEGNKYLCAYMVLDQEFDSNAFRTFLTQSLPEHMIPTMFIPIEALPLTISGKVDYRALPEPRQARMRQEADYVAPRTPTEQVIAEIWAEVLHIDRLGIHENFFTVGGHSLVAAQVITRIQSQFGVELLLQDFLAAPTIAGLAHKVEELILTKSAAVDELLGLLQDMSEEEAQQLLAMEYDITLPRRE